MSSPRKDPSFQAELAHQGQDDDFDPASLDDLASLLVEALTIPLAADLQDAAEPRSQAIKVRDTLPPGAHSRH